MRHWNGWIGACLVAIATGTGYLGATPVFHPASVEAVPFRCDRLPVDVDRMHEMAGDLTTLAASAAKDGNPAKLRAAAQLLAVAKALDPNRAGIATMESKLAKGRALPPPDPKELTRASRRAWEYRNWLDKEQSGRDARIFAACLGDALAVATPDHRQAAALRKAGEQGPWKGWVADLSAFRSPSKPDPKPDLAIRDPKESNPDEKKPEVPPAKEPSVTIRLGQASVRVPIEYKFSPPAPKPVPDATTPPAATPPPSEIRFDTLPVEIKAWSKTANPGKEKDAKSPPPAPVPEYLVVGFVDEKDKTATKSVETAMKKIRAVLSDRHGGLPSGGRLQFHFGPAKSYDWKQNRTAMAGAVALLMDATLSGNAPDPDAIVFAGIDSEGRVNLPWKPWDRLRRIADDENIPGGRFVLPRAALPLLDGLLVIEKPGFFLRFEVLLAGNMDELVACAAGRPEGELASAMEKFAAIRETAKGKQIGPFLANRFVRQRLAEVVNEFPDHASARMLLAQSGGKRPMEYDTELLAREIRMALKPMAWIPERKLGSKMEGFSKNDLESAWKACRERLDPLKSQVTRDDRELFDRAFKLLQLLRTSAKDMQRYRRAIRQDPDSIDHIVGKAFRLQKSLAESYLRLMNEIGVLTGEVDPNTAKEAENPDHQNAAGKPNAK